jgi:hypothetical protein
VRAQLEEADVGPADGGDPEGHPALSQVSAPARRAPPAPRRPETAPDVSPERGATRVLPRRDPLERDAPRVEWPWAELICSHLEEIAAVLRRNHARALRGGSGATGRDRGMACRDRSCRR